MQLIIYDLSYLLEAWKKNIAYKEKIHVMINHLCREKLDNINANKKVKIAAAAIAVVLVKRIMKNVEKNG